MGEKVYSHCPLMNKGYDACYGAEMSSLRVADMVYYCGNNYMECEKYKTRAGGLKVGKRILIADDSPSMRQLVSFSLEDAGYEVLTAADGTEALEKLKGNSIDMIITDLNMPKMNGIELIKKLRNGAGFGFRPILMLTTESCDDMKMQGKEAGASAWIIKPFTPEKLIEVVRKLLR